MTPEFTDELVTLYHGDCLEVLRELPAESIDALVTDPPAGIGFMGKEWDSFTGKAVAEPDKPQPGPGRWVGQHTVGTPTGRERDAFIAFMTASATECLRVLKPGAHGLVWAIPRTSHWTATALEDAGFEVRDVITHHFGSGFPKSLDVSKAIDKAAGAERQVVGTKLGRPGYSLSPEPGQGVAMEGNVDGSLRDPVAESEITAPATDDAARWSGWGTALKPASEHWLLIRKPLSEPNVAANVLRWNVGGINIDACRIGLDVAQHEGRESGAASERNRISDLLGVRQGVVDSESDQSAEEVAADLRSKMPIAADDRELQPQLEDRELHRQTPGLSLDQGGGGKSRLSSRTSSRDGGEAGATTEASRTRAPHQRRQTRQPPGEPRPPGNGDGSLAPSSSGSAGDERIAATDRGIGGGTQGRWPANLILSHSKRCVKLAGQRKVRGDNREGGQGRRDGGFVDTGAESGDPQPNGPLYGDSEVEMYECSEDCPVAELDRQSGNRPAGSSVTGNEPSEPATNVYGEYDRKPWTGYGDMGGASRFFYTAKADRSERNAGLEGLEEKPMLWSSGTQNPGSFQAEGTRKSARNFHPTVKPIDLMRYLCKMITPPGGVVLDCFAGSGSTGVAAKLEGFHCILIEKESDYVEIIKRRLGWAVHEPELFA